MEVLSSRTIPTLLPHFIIYAPITVQPDIPGQSEAVRCWPSTRGRFRSCFWLSGQLRAVGPVKDPCHLSLCGHSPGRASLPEDPPVLISSTSWSARARPPGAGARRARVSGGSSRTRGGRNPGCLPDALASIPFSSYSQSVSSKVGLWWISPSLENVSEASSLTAKNLCLWCSGPSTLGPVCCPCNTSLPLLSLLFKNTYGDHLLGALPIHRNCHWVKITWFIPVQEWGAQWGSFPCPSHSSACLAPLALVTVGCRALRLCSDTRRGRRTVVHFWPLVTIKGHWSQCMGVHGWTHTQTHTLSKHAGTQLWRQALRCWQGTFKSYRIRCWALGWGPTPSFPGMSPKTLGWGGNSRGL